MGAVHRGTGSFTIKGEDMKPKSRKVKYADWLTEEGLSKLEEWAKQGLIDTQIAHNMGIHPSTLYDWINKYPEIGESLKRGKEVIDLEVENALLKRALGYEYKEVKKIATEDGKKRVEETTKQVIPDTTAQIFWLKNRKPRQWRDKQDIEHTGNLGIKIDWGEDEDNQT